VGKVADIARASPADTGDCLERLARGASLELNCLERDEFHAARELLRPGQRIYVSHLPRQTWEQTLELCAVVAAAGCDPVPHIPVRLLTDGLQPAALLRAAFDAGVREPLLLAGDYPKPKGPFGDVMSLLRTGMVETCGFKRVSFAGHPEGHPVVPSREIRQAQVDKWRMASAQGMQVTFVTQFFFAAKPFSQWACELRSEGVQARLVAGLAGPTGISRLLRLARRCGVGPSIRALTARRGALLGLITDHDPDALLRDLADEGQRCTGLFDGVHLFSFGGFLRTASWLHQYTRARQGS
jgi:methylenetetrahydrofolate reductase (NADPH)